MDIRSLMGNVDRRALCPSSNFGTPVDHRMLGVLEIQHSGRRPEIQHIDDPLEDRKKDGSFSGNPVLRLIIEWSIEAVQV